MDDECSLLVTTMRLQDAKSTIGTFHLISLAELVALSIPTMVRAITPPQERVSHIRHYLGTSLTVLWVELWDPSSASKINNDKDTYSNNILLGKSAFIFVWQFVNI